MQKKTKRIIILIILLLITISIILILTKNTNKPIPQPLTEQAKAQYETIIGNQAYNITDAVLEANAINPTVSAGMIPIKWNGTNWVITTQAEDWYDYANGQPAYIMLNDGYYRSEIEQEVKEEQLMENNVETIITRPEDLGTIYMWIPRFAYNAQGEILYIKQGSIVAGTYTMPEIFTYETEKRDFSLAGIWVEYNPLANTKAVDNKIKDMQGPNNKYGFIANTQGINANNETTYQTTIETYINKLTANVVGVGVHDDSITDILNQNRTILKITNTNQLEPIKAKVYYNETEEKIKIEVTYNTNKITKILDKNGKELSTNSTIADSGSEPIGNKNYKYIVIDNQGNQKQLTVSVSGLDIYIIETEEDLKLFRNAVNSGKTTVNTKAYQIADIKMNEGKYEIDKDSGEIIFNSDAEQWVPIAQNNRYYGNYYGNNHIISGIYINSTSNYIGLFGRTSGVVQDLGIIDSRITGSRYVAGVVAYCEGTIMNCYNAGKITGTSYSIGGIAGEMDVAGTITNCYNAGNISGTNSEVGGIVGYACNVGKAENKKIINCYNVGNINGTTKVGGILGYGVANIINNCYNIGKISGSGSYVGGIAGDGSIVSNCYNTGKVTGGSYLGGIQGRQNVSTTNCYYLSETASYGIGSPRGDSGCTVCATIEEIPKLSLINGDNAFVEDTNNINNGYPILAWQAQ